MMEWLKDFNVLNDSNEIYNIHNPINKNIIQFLKSNQEVPFQIYYWFEINRYLFPDYQWTHCPLSKTKLIDLEIDYSYENSLISEKYHLVFPL